MRDIADYQENYKKEPFEQYQVFYRRKKVLQLLNKYSHKNILEVGCGLNPLFTSIDDFETMTIVEPASEFVEIARNAALEDGRAINCIRGFLEEQVSELENETRFDYIVVSSLLHEVENPKVLLEGIRKLCDTDTIVHINVPNAKSFHRMIASEMGIIENIYQRSKMQELLQQRQRVFDLDSIQKTVEESDFEVVEKGTYFPKFLSHEQLQACIDQRILNDAILEGIYKLEKYVPEFGSELYVQLRIKR